jgi:hypothetical protein
MLMNLSRLTLVALAVAVITASGQTLVAQPIPPTGPNSGGCPKDDPVCLGATSGPQYRSDVGNQRAPASDTAAANNLVGETGYIWIGNLAAGDAITSSNLGTTDGKTDNLAKLTAMQEYQVSANLDLRENLPNNDTLYFRGQRLVGLLRSGRKVVLLATPVPIQRAAVTQLWAKVRVE